MAIDWGGKKTMHIIFRHAEKIVREDYTNEAPNYPMITKLGEAQTRAAAVGLFEIIKDAPQGSVMIFCGCSKAARTQSTLAVLANEVRRLCWEKEYITLSLPKIKDSLLKSFSEVIENLPTKIIVEYPSILPEFAAPPDKDATNVAGEMIEGLKRMEAIFRLFFPERYLFLISVGHSREIELSMELLGNAEVPQETAHYRWIL